MKIAWDEYHKGWIITIKCPWCKGTSEVFMTTQQKAQWDTHVLTQNIKPTLDKTDREILISGFCVDCQAKIFMEDDNE